MKYALLTIACGALLLGGVACGDDGGEGAGGGGTGGTGSGTAAGTGTGSGTGSGTASGTGSGTASGTGSGMGGGGEGGSMCTGMGELTFGEACECDDQCDSGLCYPFGTGPRCTIPCPADPADCPNDGAGCNNMDPAVCKTM